MKPFVRTLLLAFLALSLVAGALPAGASHNAKKLAIMNPQTQESVIP